MINISHANNYISKCQTFNNVYCSYHLNNISLSTQDLLQIIDPEIIYDFKEKCKTLPLFKDIETISNNNVLPPNINCDNLLENIRTTLASCLIFIHTWSNENNCNLINNNYETYEEFLYNLLEHIISEEKDDNIRETALSLKDSSIDIFPYLYKYQGNMKHRVFNYQDLLSVITAIFILNIADKYLPY